MPRMISSVDKNFKYSFLGKKLKNNYLILQKIEFVPA